MSGVLDGADDPDLLAGEYVLGVLDDAQMRVVRAQALSDAALRAAIRAWERRLAPLAAAIVERVPPPALWQRIEAAVAPLPQMPANDLPPLPLRPRRAVGWPIATAVSLALAAGLAALAFLPRAPAPLGEVAAIAPLGGAAPAFVANARPDGSVVLAALSPAAVPAGKDLEVWLLPAGAKGVSPVGLLPQTGATLKLPALPATGSQLLISLEPKGGSTTGQPTGPVLYGGTLTSL